VLGTAEAVAEAKGGVSDPETTAIGQLKEALGA
jgi:tellurite resistance protein